MTFFLEAVAVLGLAIVLAGVLLSLLAGDQDLEEAEPEQEPARPPRPAPAMRQAASSSARACAAAKSRSPE